MDHPHQWNPSMKPFFPRPDNPAASFGLVYDSNFLYDQTPPAPGAGAGMAEMKQHHHHPGMLEMPAHHRHLMAPADVDMVDNNSHIQQERKKKLTSDQLDSLERCFQEEIKLHPERKMQLARELGLQPRQIAVWFQNRRARWKNKQLEHLYDALKHDYDAVSRQKHKLQQQVIKLQEIIREQQQQGLRKQQQPQVSGFTTELSGEETVESTQNDVGCSTGAATTLIRGPTMGKNNYYLNVNVVEDYNHNVTNNTAVASNYLGVLPPYP